MSDVITVKKTRVKEYPRRAFLVNFFDYEQDSGELIWRRNFGMCKGRKAGTYVGRLTAHGYKMVFLARQGFLVHRLVWIFHKGPIPKGFEIDHKDGNRSNNRIKNLRLVTRAENMRNKTPHGDVKRLGVAKLSTGMWHATASLEGRPVSLGKYPTQRQASCAAKGWRLQNGYTPRHVGLARERKAAKVEIVPPRKHMKRAQPPHLEG